MRSVDAGAVVTAVMVVAYAVGLASYHVLKARVWAARERRRESFWRRLDTVPASKERP